MHPPRPYTTQVITTVYGFDRWVGLKEDNERLDIEERERKIAKRLLGLSYLDRSTEPLHLKGPHVLPVIVCQSSFIQHNSTIVLLILPFLYTKSHLDGGGPVKDLTLVSESPRPRSSRSHPREEENRRRLKRKRKNTDMKKHGQKYGQYGSSYI